MRLSYLKWGLLLLGSTVVGLGLGSFLTDFLLESFILRAAS
jgi:hypothetical protein